MRSDEAAVLGEELRRDWDAFQGASIRVSSVVDSVADADRLWLNLSEQFDALYRTLTEAFPDEELFSASLTEPIFDSEQFAVRSRTPLAHGAPARQGRTVSAEPPPVADAIPPSLLESERPPHKQARQHTVPPASSRFTHPAEDEEELLEFASLSPQPEPCQEAPEGRGGKHPSARFNAAVRAESDNRPLGGLRDLAWDLEPGPAPRGTAHSLLSSSEPVAAISRGFGRQSTDAGTPIEQPAAEQRDAATSRSLPHTGAVNRSDEELRPIDVDDLMDAIVEKIERDYRRFYGS